MLRKGMFNKIKQKTLYLNDNAIGITETENIDIYNIHLHWSSSAKRKNELNKIELAAQTIRKPIIPKSLI